LTFFYTLTHVEHEFASRDNIDFSTHTKNSHFWRVFQDPKKELKTWFLTIFDINEIIEHIEVIKRALTSKRKSSTSSNGKKAERCKASKKQAFVEDHKKGPIFGTLSPGTWWAELTLLTNFLEFGNSVTLRSRISTSLEEHDEWPAGMRDVMVKRRSRNTPGRVQRRPARLHKIVARIATQWRIADTRHQNPARGFLWRIFLWAPWHEDAEHDVRCGNSSHELDRFMVWLRSAIEKFFSIMVCVWRIDAIDRCVACV